MKITLYNTLAQKKEVLEPYENKKVRMYVCGPTVYDSAHLGHARAAVTFDIINRFLRFAGYDVTYVRNFTDIDDKIIARANERGVSAEEISKRYIEEYINDMDAIGVLTPDVQPKVTEHVPEIIEMIGDIIDRGYAYQSGNDVFFSVKKFEGYGKLSRRHPDDMLAGIRIDINEKKEDPLDFALWKGAKPNEPSWDSPWGLGRPGWHIECSTMSTKYLGKSFEIHGGGKDLIFPHHENEIAQSEAATGEQFARYWIHNGLIQINREKMSKSIGNILNVRDALESWDKEAIRLFFLSHQYLNPADFSDTIMDESEAALERLYITLKRIEDAAPRNGAPDPDLETSVATFKENWVQTMCDDFNTADAVGNLFELTRAVNRSLDSKGGSESLDSSTEAIREFGHTLGILEMRPAEYLQKSKLEKVSSEIEEREIVELIKERTQARQDKNWERADEIRDYLNSKGIILDDNPGGTDWRIKS